MLGIYKYFLFFGPEQCCHKDSLHFYNTQISIPSFSFIFTICTVAGRHFVDEEIEAQGILTFSRTYLPFNQAIVN